jgi:hypothetical protein
MLTSASPIRRLGLLTAVALFVAACGGSVATPTPVPTPVPTPTPSPTPVDVGAIVLKTVQASDFSAAFTLEGTGTFGDQAITWTGTLDMAGGDSHSSTKNAMGTTSWTSESIGVGGKSWDSSSDGPWIPSANTKCNNDMDALGLAKALTDQGTVTKGGKTVHRLTIKGGVDASCVKSTSVLMTKMTMTLELYATDEGKLVGMSETAAWTQLSGGTSVSVKMSSEATATGKPAGTIKAPTAPWNLYENTDGHFRVAYPADWTEQLLQGRPSLSDPDQKYVVTFLVSALPAGYTLSEYSKANLASLKPLASLKVNQNTTAGLGGEAAGFFQIHYSVGGRPLHGLDVFTVHDGSSYDVFWGCVAGTEQADLEMFYNIVNSFAFTQ